MCVKVCAMVRVKESCVKVLWVKECCGTGVGAKMLSIQVFRGKVCVCVCVKELCGTEMCVEVVEAWYKNMVKHVCVCVFFFFHAPFL